MQPSEKLSIVKKLFPTKEKITWTKENVEEKDIRQFQEKEIVEGAKKLKNKKAPGPDGIPGDVIKYVIENQPDYFLQDYVTKDNTQKSGRQLD